MSQKTLQPSLLFALFFLSFIVGYSQTQPVTGKVIDGKTNTPLASASVVVKGNTNIGTSTDADGNFSIQAPGNGTLVITSTGFESREIPINNQRTLSVTLTSTASTLTDVVVIGYGSRQKRDLIGSVSEIRPRDIERSTNLSPEQALQGQMPGVQITQQSGDPNARLTVRVRGTSTFTGNGAADPLYVVDGIPIIEGGQGITPDPINDPTRRGDLNIYSIINPNDIESISVLKDASATAVYGIRGANGVILITTKSGKGGKVRVEFNGSYGISNVPKQYDVLNTQQYVDFYTNAYNANPKKNNDIPIPIGEETEFFGSRWDPASTDFIGNEGTYDWQRAVRKKNAIIQDYAVRAAGGSGPTTYNFSLGYSNQESPFVGTNTQRFTVSTNINSKIGKYIEVGLNVRGIQQNRKDQGADGDLEVYKAAPFQKIYDENGINGYAPLWRLNEPLTPTAFDFSPLYIRQGVPFSNTIAGASTGYTKSLNQTGLGTAYLQINPIAGLKIRGSISLQQITLRNDNYTNFDVWYFQETPGNPFSNVPNPAAGTRPIQLSVFNSITTSKTTALNADYTKSFGKHNINLTADISQQDYVWTVNGSNGTNLVDDPSLHFFSPSGMDRAYNETRDRYTLIGYLGRVSYNYDNKYYIDGVIRRDGTSKFAPGHQFGSFPSGAVGWRISQEDFFSDVRIINELKLRGSYGLLGNQTTKGWQFISVSGANFPNYNLGIPNTNQAGIAYTNFPNEFLSWEKLYSLNVGFDAQLLDNSLSVTFDYYNKVTKGIIQSILLAPSSGIQQEADLNIADVLNRGIELTLGYTRKFGQVGFNISGNITTQHNEVLKLANENAALRGEQNSLEVGFPINYFNGYEVAGIFPDQKSIDDYNAVYDDVSSAGAAPGDLYFRDVYGSPKAGSTERNNNPDSIINSDDQTYIGKSIPGYYGGVQLGFDFRGFDLSALFTFRGDVQRYNTVRAQGGETMNGYGRNMLTDVLDAWTPDNTNTSIPRAVYGDPNDNVRFSDRWIEDAGYFRLQNVQLGYNFSPQFLARTKVISNFRIFLTGINLFTITPYSGLDPEASDFFPASRQFLVGVKATF